MIEYTTEDYLFGLGDLDSIQEAYKGKTKGLLQLEKIIGENRKKYIGTFKVGGSYYMDKDFIKIGDKIADIFNFKVCDFNLVNDPAPNAFTIPCGYSFTANGDTLTAKVNKDGTYKYKDLSTVIRVTSGMWTNPTFTDGEITAIIVHEVGHNFQHAVNSYIRFYTQMMFFLKLFQNVVLIMNPSSTANGIYNIIASDSELRANMNRWTKSNSTGHIIGALSNIVGFIKLISYEVASLSVRMTLGIPAGLISLSNIVAAGASNPIYILCAMITSSVSKSQENLSDMWASDFGYGPELISALAKIDLDPEAAISTVERISKKLPLFDSICTAFGLPLMIVSQLFANHPVNGKRAANIVAEMRKELNRSDVSPKMKKEIEAQIKEIEGVVEEYSKVDNPMEGTALRKAIFKFTANFDKDPKGWLQRAYSQRDLMESLNMIELDELGDYDYLDEFID